MPPCSPQSEPDQRKYPHRLLRCSIPVSISAALTAWPTGKTHCLAPHPTSCHYRTTPLTDAFTLRVEREIGPRLPAFIISRVTSSCEAVATSCAGASIYSKPFSFQGRARDTCFLSVLLFAVNSSSKRRDLSRLISSSFVAWVVHPFLVGILIACH